MEVWHWPYLPNLWTRLASTIQNHARHSVSVGLDSPVGMPQPSKMFCWNLPDFGKKSRLVKMSSSARVRVEFIGVLRQTQRYFSHICDGTDVQAAWRRSCTYGRAPNTIDISQGSLNVPVLHRNGTTLFIRWFRHPPPPFSRLLRHAGDTEDVLST